MWNEGSLQILLYEILEKEIPISSIDGIGIAEEISVIEMNQIVIEDKRHSFWIVLLIDRCDFLQDIHFDQFVDQIIRS